MEKLLVIFWYNQSQMFIFHFLKLILCYARLQGKEMLVGNPIRLIKNLAPSVFACCFCTQHCQFVRREYNIMVTIAVGENKIWFFLVFCDDLPIEYNFLNDSWNFLGNANIFGRLRRYL